MILQNKNLLSSSSSSSSRVVFVLSCSWIIITIAFSLVSYSSSSSTTIIVHAADLNNPRPPNFYTPERMLEIRKSVVAAFRHAYDGYKTHAFPMDELKPLSCKGTDHFGRYSMTAIDSLDTLALIGDYDEFFAITDHLYKNVHFDGDVTVSVFETTIRVIGGLTTAHELALKMKAKLNPHRFPAAQKYTDQLLQICVRVADRMISAFDTPTGIPFNEINLKMKSPDPAKGHATCPAAAGSLLLEFGYLSHLTGNCTYLQLARQAFLGLWKHRAPHNLVGTMIDIYNGVWINGEANIGASVDSFYEYMTKAYVLSGDKVYFDMWEQASKSIYKHTFFSGWYLSSSVEWRGPLENFDHRFNSLQTFWPGLQALSGDVVGAIGSFEKIHCIARTLKLPPEYISIAEYVTKSNTPKKSGPGYPLRPEVIESAFFLHRATQEDYFLNVGEHFLNHLDRSKTKCGYAAVLDVWLMTLEDKMESFLLSETLKYLYLMFTPPKWKLNNNNNNNNQREEPFEMFNLDEGYIVNTEAHPIPITSEMKETYKRCSAELHMLPHMSENVLKDDWTVHPPDVYENHQKAAKFLREADMLYSDQKKCPVLDYWRDIAPAMDSLRNLASCYTFVDTTVLASKPDFYTRIPRQMAQARPIQVVLPDGTKTTVLSNILSEAARAAAELRQTNHFQAGPYNNNVNANNNNNNNNAQGQTNNKNNNHQQNQQQQQQFAQSQDVVALEIPGDSTNQLHDGAITFHLTLPQRMRNQETVAKAETRHGIVHFPMLIQTLPMFFSGTEIPEILRIEFETYESSYITSSATSTFSSEDEISNREGNNNNNNNKNQPYFFANRKKLVSAGFLTGRAAFGPSTCARPAKAYIPSSSGYSTSKTTTTTTTTTSSTSKEKENNNDQQETGSSPSPPLPPPLETASEKEKAVSGPLFVAETNLCDAASEAQVEQMLKLIPRDEFPELRQNVSSADPIRFGLLISRGDCTFKEKVQRAQRLGATFAVISDTVKGGTLVEMADSPTSITEEVRIPSVFITEANSRSILNFINLQEKEHRLRQAQQEQRARRRRNRKNTNNINNNNNNNNNNQNSKQEQEESPSTSTASATSTSSTFVPFIRINAKIKCVDTSESQLASIGVSLIDVPNINKIFISPIRLRPVAMMLKERSTFVFPKILYDEILYRKSFSSKNNNKKIGTFELIEELSCPSCCFFLSYFTNENNNYLPSWPTLETLARGTLRSENLIAMFDWKVAKNKASSSSSSASSDYGVVGALIKTDDANVISSSFKFSKELTYVLKKPIVYIRGKKELVGHAKNIIGNDAAATSAGSGDDEQKNEKEKTHPLLRIEIVTLVDKKEEIAMDFLATEIAIHYTLRKYEKILSSSKNDKNQDGKADHDNDEEHDEDKDDEEEEYYYDRYNDFGIKCRIVGEDPDKPGRYVIVTMFDSLAAAKQYQVVPSPKTEFNELNVLLLRQFMNSVSDVTMELKEELGGLF